MRKLVVFNSVTVDGYFTDANGDISWAKENQDAQFRFSIAFWGARLKSSGTPAKELT